MRNNINKYLTDIDLNLVTYKNVPNIHVLEQYDFEALDNNSEIVIGSILFSFSQIDISFIKDGIKHLYSCMIKHSSITDCVIQNTHSILDDNEEKVIIKTITRENIPIEEYFNFQSLDKNKETKVLVYC